MRVDAIEVSKPSHNKFFSNKISLPPFEDEEIRGHSSVLSRLIDNDWLSKSNQKIDFAFLVHPRDPYDALACARFMGTNLGFLAGLVPQSFEQGLKNKFLYKSLAKVPPFVIRNSFITFENSPVRGALVAVLLYGEQMMTNGWRRYSMERIVEAIELAKDRGAKLVGLGAHTSPATGGGRLLRFTDDKGEFKYPQIADIGITNGNSFTAAMTFEAIKQSSERLGLTPEGTKVGIVGAGGSVGSATSRLIVKEGFTDPILIGTSVPKLQNAFKDLKGGARFSNQLSDLKECDVVAIMTSSTTATVLPEHLTPGTEVVEDTQPRNIKKEMGEIMRENGILVVDGGFVYIPGYSCGFNLRLPRRTAFACLAETGLRALEGKWEDYSIGDAEVEKAEEMMRLSRKHNFRLADPTWNSEPINSEYFEKVKLLNSRRHTNSRVISHAS